ILDLVSGHRQVEPTWLGALGERLDRDGVAPTEGGQEQLDRTEVDPLAVADRDDAAAMVLDTVRLRADPLEVDAAQARFLAHALTLGRKRALGTRRAGQGTGLRLRRRGRPRRARRSSPGSPRPRSPPRLQPPGRRRGS